MGQLFIKEKCLICRLIKIENIHHKLKNNINRFADINQFFETTGFEKRTDIAEFFVFTFGELSASSRMKMPTYQKDFYQITIITQGDKAEIAINNQHQNTLENTLYFLSPDHVFSWQRSVNTSGFIVYFKPHFLDFYSGSIAADFSFFDLTENNILQITAEQSTDLAADFAKLYKEFHTPNTYRVQILQSFLLSLLFKCKSLFHSFSNPDIKPSKKQDLVFKFKNLVNNCYLTEKQVGDYAQKLFVSANMLNQAVKELTGKTAKEVIAEKITQEAQKQLHYSTDDIAEIAFYLGFEEPTHFIRFFKSQTSLTPKEYRFSKM
jgi:AraC family transcriptional regulator, transcriptional activator of pobA